MPWLIALKVLGNIENDYLHVFGGFSPLFEIQDGSRRPILKKKCGNFFSMPQFASGQFQAKKKKKKIFAIEKKKNLGLRKILEFLENVLIFFLCIVKVSLCHLCVLQFEV